MIGLKKTVLFVLIAAMTLIPLCSCGSTGKATHPEDAYIPATGTGITGESAELDSYVDYLASQNDISGNTFTWIGGGAQTPTADEDTGDVMSDALYYRQREIEEKFGVIWSNYVPPELEDRSVHAVVEAVKQDVLAGTCAYDAGYGTAVAVCQPLFIQSLLTDATEFEVLDLDNEWWTQSLRDSYSIGGAVYFLNGAIVSSNYLDAYGILFSKKAVLDYGIGDLYSLVKENHWTFDKMFQVASAIPTNANGSGAYRYASPNGFAILFGNGLTVTKYDSYGNPYVPEAFPEELSDLADKFSYYFGNRSVTAPYGGGEMLAEGGVLFMFATMQTAAEMRRMENVEFGILPIPKGDEKQPEYISYAEPWTAFHVFIPKSGKDMKTTDVVLEAMGALGAKYIKPTYYDTILKNRSTYDSESQEMIDIIFRTKVYDLLDILATGGGNNGDSDLVNVLKNAIVNSSSGVTSRYNMQARIVNQNIRKILNKIENNQM